MCARVELYQNALVATGQIKLVPAETPAAAETPAIAAKPKAKRQAVGGETEKAAAAEEAKEPGILEKVFGTGAETAEQPPPPPGAEISVSCQHQRSWHRAGQDDKRNPD